MRAAWLLLACAAAACSDDRPALRLAYDPPALGDAAAALSAYLVRDCPPDAVLGAPPAAPLATAVVPAYETPSLLDDADEGDYGVHVIARDAQCAVVAAGCRHVRIDGSGGTLDVILTAPPSSEGCPAEEMCVGGACVQGGECAELGAPCSLSLPCCGGQCAPETGRCVHVE